MPGLRSLRNRLAVIFALIIIGAIGTIYLSVTPRLDASLTAQTLDRVRATSEQRTSEVAQFLYPPRDLFAEDEVPKTEDGLTMRPRSANDARAAPRASRSGSAPK